jgi:hypothetical protein
MSMCGATNRMKRRIAAPENVPEPSSIASPNLLSLPHRTRPEPELLCIFLISITCWCGPCELWATRPHRPSAAANPQGFGESRDYQAKQVSVLQIDRSTSTADGCRPPPRPWGTRHACRLAGVITTAPLRVLDMRGCHCKSLRNDLQAAVPAQAGIIRLRHRALLRRSQSQALSLGLRRPVAAQLLAATL